jgi:hypothetical protein
MEVPKAVIQGHEPPLHKSHLLRQALYKAKNDEERRQILAPYFAVTAKSDPRCFDELDNEWFEDGEKLQGSEDGHSRSRKTSVTGAVDVEGKVRTKATLEWLLWSVSPSSTGGTPMAVILRECA